MGIGELLARSCKAIPRRREDPVLSAYVLSPFIEGSPVPQVYTVHLPSRELP